MYYTLVSFKHWCIDFLKMVKCHQNMQQNTRYSTVVYVRCVYAVFMETILLC